ncbi:MAG: RpiB/LacA/LacB family sugar-phosphate isomerase, partial [Faecalibacterium sp.]|nr:RpiB/LacA/LacB family sugar-phosphate isomerase [Faecalibacterium sp.]
MKIAIGNDHGGLNLKAAVIGALKEEGAEVVNFGTDTPDS